MNLGNCTMAQKQTADYFEPDIIVLLTVFGPQSQLQFLFACNIVTLGELP